MVTEALKEKVMNYFTILNDEQALMVIAYIETIDFSQNNKRKSLADLKGKIHFAAQPARKQPPDPLRGLRLCSELPAVQRESDLPHGQRAPDVPLLRPFQACFPAVPGMRRPPQTGRHRNPAIGI